MKLQLVVNLILLSLVLADSCKESSSHCGTILDWYLQVSDDSWAESNGWVKVYVQRDDSYYCKAYYEVFEPLFGVQYPTAVYKCSGSLSSDIIVKHHGNNGIGVGALKIFKPNSSSTTARGYSMFTGVGAYGDGYCKSDDSLLGNFILDCKGDECFLGGQSYQAEGLCSSEYYIHFNVYDDH